MKQNRLLRLWLLMLLATCAANIYAADWMTYSDKFSMNSYTNHVRFNVFLCDLDRSNTYAKSNGGVYAVDASGNQKWLMDLIYIE